MIKRTIEISRAAVHLRVENEQLVLVERGEARRELARVPCEDVGLLLVDQPQTTYTHAALAALLRYDAAVVICGDDHLPVGLLAPMAEPTEVVHRLRAQIELRPPRRKQLWKQIVSAKIRAQAANLGAGTPGRSRLLELARTVRSGDPGNYEAQAAQVYWRDWLDGIEADELVTGPFRRDPDRPGLNRLLNYGYAVLRAAVAREIVAGGLQAAIGLHHRNRSNAFCLADDLMEPLRPLVDEVVRRIAVSETTELNPTTKEPLLAVLTREVNVGGQRGPLMVSLHRYVASLVRCLVGETTRLDVPVATEPNGPPSESDESCS